MRRWLILFLVFVLPLQLSWAAAGIACAHETGPAADHFGHHVHQHQDSGKSVEHGKSVADKGQADTDCPYCHVSVPTPVVEFLSRIAVMEPRMFGVMEPVSGC